MHITSTGMKCLCARWSPAFVVLALIAALSMTGARAGDGPQAPIIALTNDPSSGALLKSDGKALYRSVDQGASWASIPLPPLAGGSIAAIAVPADRAGAVFIAGPGLGVLSTENEGSSWTRSNTGLPSNEVTAFAAHATLGETLYAFVPENGIYRSQDAGENWKLVDKGPKEIQQLIHTDMQGSMETGWLYAATSQGVRVSMDCFCLWRDAGELNGQTDTVAYDPQQPERLYAASEQGLFRSTNGGQEWEPATAPDALVAALTVTSSGIVFAASSDGALFRSTDHAETWERVGE